MCRFSMCVLLVALVAGTAVAGPFVHSNRFDAESRLGADVSYVVLEGDADVTVLRFGLQGHYVHPESGGGFYAQIPVGYLAASGETEAALGNLELGGLYMPKSLTGPLQVVLRGGITLPTAGDDSSTPVGLVAALARPPDLFLNIPEGVTARLGGSVLYDAGQVYFRGDLGIDVNVSSALVEPDPAVIFNMGVGLKMSPQAALTGELTSISFEDENLFSLGIGARFFAGGLWPYLGLQVPLSEALGDLMDLALVAGIDARI